MQLSIMLLVIVTWLYCVIIIPNDINREARETRHLCIDDRLFVTNVVDDGKVVWERGKTEAR